MEENFPKCLVVGAGWLGHKIATSLPNCFLTDKMVNSVQDVIALIDEYEPQVIINAAGTTGRPNVDWCEDHKPETYFGNVHVPYLLAEGCRERGLKLFHLSSGCIYQADNNGVGWKETDEPNFQGSYYSHTKAVCERLLTAYSNVLICRIRMPFDKEPSERDLLSKLLKYEKIISFPNSITIVDDLLEVIKKMIAKDLTGTFNCVNENPITAKEILEIYEEESGKNLNKQYVPIEEIKIKAPRSNCVLSTEKMTAYGLAMPETFAGVRQCIKEYIKKQA